MILEPVALKSYTAEITASINDKNFEQAAQLSSRISTARFADILKEAERESIIPCLQAIKPDRAGRILGHFPTQLAAEILEEIDRDTAAGLLSNVPVDRAADIIDLLDDDLQVYVLDHLLPEARSVIDGLMHHEPGTAGSAMTAYYLAIRSGSTIGETLEAVRDAPSHIESRSYIYVVDDQEHLLGVVSLKELLQRNPQERIDDSMRTDVIAVHVNDPALEAAQIMRLRRFQLMPVLDLSNKLAGVIVLDDALDILTREVADSFVGIGGASVEESFFTPPTESVKRRLPWMAGNIFLNLGAVAVIAYFEDTIAAVAALAVFLPMITDMGGNVGIQALSVSIRSIALGEARIRDFWVACRKEVIIGLINGLALGALFAVIAYMIYGNPLLGAVAGAALGVNVFVAGIVGGSLPFLIKKLGKDPAMMTGPVLTTITDITGVTIYLGLATYFLSYMF